MKDHETLLLCFIHGFKGGDNTFRNFPTLLRDSVATALPALDVRTVTYPKFETRGDLMQCVGRFRDWLQNQVIDIEVEHGTESPTVSPAVHVVLLGHSMGGIVAAETVLAITSDSPLPFHPASEQKGSNQAGSSLMFPDILGVLAFDTPYLGIAPSVIAHGAETHYKTASSAYSALSGVAGMLGYGASGGKKAATTPNSAKMLTQGSAAMQASSDNASSWQNWGKLAMYGAAGAVAASGAAAAYWNRDSITEGWTWFGSHLEFVGCLAKGEDLRRRLDRLIALRESHRLQFRNIITVLGRKTGQGVSLATFVQPGDGLASLVDSDKGRTFCNVPKTEANRRHFELACNNIARDETEAHMTMFEHDGNDNFQELVQRTTGVLTLWTTRLS